MRDHETKVGSWPGGVKAGGREDRRAQRGGGLTGAAAAGAEGAAVPRCRRRVR